MTGNDLIEKVPKEVKKVIEKPTDEEILNHIRNLPQHVLYNYVVELK